ncbi:MAG TPA: DUF2142 domain-containing protein [Lichenihabitans sp.]|jgi:uncharacterized membrane protein|nr:DUF2142 domain-containing protein [Lichenihabitans sp.]
MLHLRLRPLRCLWAAYLLLAFPVVVLLVFATPPFQVADEANHFLRAVQVETGHLIATRRGKQAAGGEIDGQAIDVSRAFDDLKFHPDHKLETSLLTQEDGPSWGEQPKIFADFANTAIYPPFFYAPAAIGIKLGKRFGLSILGTLYLARLVNALCATALAGAALALCGKGRATLGVILSFPMVLSLFGSVSPDALSIASGAFVIALWSKYLDRDEDIPVWPRCIAAGLLGAIIAARIPLMPLYGLVLLPTSRRRRLFSRTWLSRRDMLSIVIGLGPIAFGLLGAHVAKIPFRPDDGVAPMVQLTGLLHDPIRIVTVMIATLHDLGIGYLRQMIGVLGWLDTDFPPRFYEWMGLCITVAVAIECFGPERGLRGWSAVLLVCGLAAAVLGVFFALYLAWTPVGVAAIDGVQGRYFLVPAMVLVVVLPTFGRATKDPGGGPIDAGRLAICVTVGLVNLWIVPITILNRYYG